MHPESLQFQAHGKLLLSGEYLVLDGASALAVPTIPGQILKVEAGSPGDSNLTWESVDEKGRPWFKARFSMEHLSVLDRTDQPIASRLREILLVAKKLNPSFLGRLESLAVTTRLEFPRLWGLGTSSTLIDLIAQWAGINAFQLLAGTFGGSGYDVACARAESPLIYRLKEPGDVQPVVCPVSFYPSFSDHLYFVYLGVKQDSRAGMQHYRQKIANRQIEQEVAEISNLTSLLASCEKLSAFMSLMDEHEAMLASMLELSPVKRRIFQDFAGSVKSLGAWGGDFVLVASPEPSAYINDYFNKRGFEVCLPYRSLVKTDSRAAGLNS